MVDPGHPHAARKVQEHLEVVHHSDRGIQYASGEYVAVLQAHQMVFSMSRPANPYDNASCESFVKTLKREEIYATAYRTLEHLATNIEESSSSTTIAVGCTRRGYRTLEEFERAAESGRGERPVRRRYHPLFQPP